ncbi:MAG: 4a-hydroxytetrahydrobiopterin dehydratase [Candidatus Paceibacterota bacterium]
MKQLHILSEEEIAKEIKTLPKWRAKDGTLKAEYVFKDFKTAFAFLTCVASFAEKINHHPAWSNLYNTVSFTLSTHDAGNEITKADVKLARYISKTAVQFLN